jgi:AraC-like DNA-binding protein
MDLPVTSSSAWLRGVMQMFASQGVDLPRLFEQADVDIAWLDQPHQRFGFEAINRLWCGAVAASGRPTLGLDRQLASRYVDFDLSAHAMWPGPTLKAGLEGLARYLHLIGDSGAISIQIELHGAWIRADHGSDPRLPRQRVEFGMLTLLMLCRRVTHHPIKPLAIEFVFPDPPDLHPYLMAFACPIRFGQPATRILLRQEDLELPLAAAGAPLFSLHEKVIEERLARLGRQRTRWRAGAEIIHRLHLGEPAPAEIARAMGTREALLARALAAEGTDFARLLDEVRHDLAVHYLAEPGFPLTRVPDLLGLPDAAALAGASRRWFGMTPVQYRQLHLADRAS